MSLFVIRDIDPTVMMRLRQQAKRHERSLQAEVRAILEAAAGYSTDEAREVAARWRRRLAGTMTGDSGDLIREDRER